MKKFTLILTMFLALCSFSVFGQEKLTPRSATADIIPYEALNGGMDSGPYAISKIYDGDYNSWYWTNGKPQKDFAVTLIFNSLTEIGDIKLYFGDGDYPADNAVVEVSADESEWTSVGTVSGIDTPNESVTFNADGINAKFVRLRFTQASDKWFKFAEFEVYKYKVQVEERTISANATEGGSVTINGGNEAVTGTNDVKLVATPAYGYKFVKWTVNGEEVSTSAEYSDNTSGDKEYVANFEKYASVDEWYAAIGKPTFAAAGGTTKVASLEFSDENVSDFTYNLGQANRVNNILKVEAGKTYSLNVTYELHWGDLALYQIDKDGANKKYGYYTCVWEDSGDPYEILGRNEELMCEELGVDAFGNFEKTVSGGNTYLNLPYEIVISENQQPGDLVVVRLMIGKKGNANSAYDIDIAEGGSMDILFEVVEPENPGIYHTLSVTDNGWATLYLGFNSRIPENVEVYAVTGVKENDWLNLTQVTGVLPANTGVLVKANQGDYMFNETEDAPATIEGNKLSGALFDKNVSEEAYVLANGDRGIGLYSVVTSNGTFTCKANKAYLPASALTAEQQNSVCFRFGFDGTTAVEKVEMRNEKEEIYDLQGRRIDEITEPGIYIVNGVKVLVK